MIDYIAETEINKLKKRVCLLEKKLKKFTTPVNTTPVEVGETGWFYPLNNLFVPGTVTEDFNQLDYSDFTEDVIDYWIDQLALVNLNLEEGSKIIINTDDEGAFDGIHNVEIVHIEFDGTLHYVATDGTNAVSGTYNPA